MNCQVSQSMTFYVDLNQCQDDDLVPISLDYTTQYGPHVYVSTVTVAVGDHVELYCPDDFAFFDAEVVGRISDRACMTRVDWQSIRQVKPL